MLPYQAALLSIAGGIIAGFTYGLFFLLQRRRVFYLRASSKHRFSATLIFALVRFSILAVLWYYVLRYPSINFILLMISFLGAFWLTILTKKA